MLRELIAEAVRTLDLAGIPAPRADAEELAAHLLGLSRTELLFAEAPADFPERYRDLVCARAQRIPLQHIVGNVAFGPVVVSVGPGVFIPRPETESLFVWATGQLSPKQTIVDLCAGSGVLALALAHMQPDARVIAVEIADAAVEYTRKNAAGTIVEVLHADISNPELLNELDGAVDVIVANPPYIPDGDTLEPEVAMHDPHRALFGGLDGLDVMRLVVATAGRLLKAGGVVGVEHDDSNGVQTAELFMASGLFDDTSQRKDLVGRPRFVTARRR